MVPLGGLEPPHLAPEASALSAELQGQTYSYYTLEAGQAQAYWELDGRAHHSYEQRQRLASPKGVDIQYMVPYDYPDLCPGDARQNCSSFARPRRAEYVGCSVALGGGPMKWETV